MIDQDTSRWFRCVQPAPHAALRVYCVPFAGGGPSAFRQWPRLLPHAEVWAVHLPGRESRLIEPPIASLTEMIDMLAPILATHANAPFVLFGHSMGALLSFEITRRLEAAGDSTPRHLILSGFPAPSAPREPRAIHRLPHDQFIERLRTMGGTPDELFQHEDLLELVLPTLRADIALLETATLETDAVVSTSITALGGTHDPEVPEHSIAGWREHTRGGFDVHFFDGGHFYWQQRPEPVMERISAVMQSIVTNAP
jgi:medium-chain acyl-[acyl-carrier-protein] hydrolase